MNIHIIYQNYLTRDGKSLSIGGIQTYITNLSQLFINRGYKVYIYQQANFNFEKEYGGATVIGCRCFGKNTKLCKCLYSCAKERIKFDDLLIFGDDCFIVNNKCCKSISLQHGIFWDKPQHIDCSKTFFLMEFVLKSYRAWKLINRVKKVDQLICVDYNFVNWYRALVAYPQIKLKVIPNFSQIPITASDKNESKEVRIIFARRFFDYRGTRVFASAISKILEEYENVNVTVAGEGPDENYLRNELNKFDKKVEFIKYKSSESLCVHENKHIALVPTLGSEGTSLSLLEAMASKCAVVCTDVGGMTNIVLNDYNGKMVSAGDVNSLYSAIKYLIENPSERKEIALAGYETVKRAFSYEHWAEQWMEVIGDISDGNNGNITINNIVEWSKRK